MAIDMDSPTQDQDDKVRRFLESFFTAEPVEDEPSIVTPTMVKMTTISTESSSGKLNIVGYVA